MAARPGLERGVRILRLLLLINVGLFFAANVVAFIELAEAQSERRTLVDNAVASVVTLSRIGRDLSRERLLVDEHIFERAGLDMDRLERRIAELNRDYESARQAYDPLAIFEGERVAWERLQAQVERTRARMPEILRLSRENRDEEAVSRRMALRQDYDDIFQTLDELVAINRSAAGRSSDRANVLQRRSLTFFGGTTLLGTTLALSVSFWLARAARRRRDEIAHWGDLLETRNRELDAFAGRVAHDLRGPLTTISLSAAQLAKQAPEEDGTLGVLRRAVGRMETLIEDLLTLSRIEAQGTKSSAQAAAVAAAVEEDLAPRVQGVDGRLHMDVEPATVRGSEGLLRQALWNLGENAVKYRRPEVPLEVEIEGRDVGAGYELRVSDNGAGMSREVARQIFEPFFRGAEARSIPGTGLGLSIVRRIIEANGGRISVESQRGEGTTFTVLLPLAGDDRSA
jgi:signal transduction histidine kinase